MRDMNDTIETISGYVSDVVFRNSTNAFTVLEINVNGELHTAVGEVSDIAAGEEIELEGVWASHPTFGRQFKFTACRRSMPDTTAKLFRYLSSGAVKGIGPKTAAKIIRLFGDESFDVLERDPDRLAAIPGISKKKAAEISSEFNLRNALRRIMLELESYGVTPSESAAIYKTLGVNAVAIIRENPYILCDAVNGFSFERVEKLVSDLGVEPNPDHRDQAGILYIFTHNLYANGHTCIPRKKMYAPCEDLLGIDQARTDLMITALLAVNKLVSCEIDGREMLFLPNIYEAEKNIAVLLKRVVRHVSATADVTPSDIERIERQEGIEYAEKQRVAIRIAAEKGLLILTGGPGTGKTTAVRGIISILERKNIRVALCAPTGMAAKRMSEVTDREAKTIHRLLEVEWSEDDKPVFRRNAGNQLACGALIVDEVSMVDVELMASLLDALPLGCRVILVGDADQLPSVGPGNVLGDLIASGEMPVVCLTEIFRQAQKSLIVTNAHRVIHGEHPVLNRTDSDFFFMPRETSEAVSDTLVSLVSKRLPDAYGFSPILDIQVLCPSKRGECGTQSLNRRLQAVLNPPARTKNELRTAGGRVFREGDRVMQVKNNYDIPWKKGEETGDGVFNGDIGLIRRINYLTSLMEIDFDGRIAEYPNENLSELELAYAITVHKSQGSEYPVAVLPLIDSPRPLMYRNLLYTAVTRAKKILVVIGRQDAVYAMTDNNKTHLRYSALKAFLRE